MQNIEQLLQNVQRAATSQNHFWQFLCRNYPLAPAQNKVRYEKLLAFHQQIYGNEPATILRAPGRIEVLGGHTDYNGCPVIPVAISRDLIAVVTPRTDQQIVAHNLDPDFAPRQFKFEKRIPPFPTGDWGNYLKAAVQGLINYLRFADKAPQDFSGFNISISSSLSPAAGLSSSSALVVLGALAFLKLNALPFDKLALAKLLADAEKYVGTQGGGMDQAISLMGEAGNALKIEFNPYNVCKIPLPPDLTIVAAHSLTKAAKTEAAMDKFNRRAIECRLATAVIKKHFDDTFQTTFPVNFIGDLTSEKLGLTDDQILKHCQQALAQKYYSYEALANLLRVDIQILQQQYCLKSDQSVFPQPPEGFKLYQRFFHIFSEWKRVLKAVDVLRAGNLIEFGQIMNQSHQGSRDNYEISTPAVERLINLGLQNGALGARLTGGGFGGFTLQLVERNAVDHFIRQLIKTFYEPQQDRFQTQTENCQDYIFICDAVDGAGVVLE